jgi:hypothetical protein
VSGGGEGEGRGGPLTERDTLQALGHQETLVYEPWPEVFEKYLASDTFNLPIQVPALPHIQDTPL